MSYSRNEMPVQFVESDAEDNGSHSPTNDTVARKVEPMMVNSATSTGTLVMTPTIKYPVKPAKTEHVPNIDANEFRPRAPTHHGEVNDVPRLLKQYSDIMASLNTIITKQNTLNNMIIELKAEFEVLKRSSARFTTPAPVSAVKTIRRVFRP